MPHTHHSALAAACAIWATSAGCSNTTMATLPSGAPGMAATTAAVAAVATASVGCTFQGCPYGSYCNTETKLCVARSCEEGCPTNTVCNEGLHLCQAPSLAKTPNDFLPQDRPTMQNFGGEQGWYGM